LATDNWQQAKKQPYEVDQSPRLRSVLWLSLQLCSGFLSTQMQQLKTNKLRNLITQ